MQKNGNVTHISRILENQNANFWILYHKFLNQYYLNITRDLSVIDKSKIFAKDQQQNICQTTFLLFQQKKIKTTSKFNYAVISHEAIK